MRKQIVSLLFPVLLTYSSQTVFAAQEIPVINGNTTALSQDAGRVVVAIDTELSEDGYYFVCDNGLYFTDSVYVVDGKKASFESDFYDEIECTYGVYKAFSPDESGLNLVCSDLTCHDGQILFGDIVEQSGIDFIVAYSFVNSEGNIKESGVTYSIGGKTTVFTYGSEFSGITLRIDAVYPLNVEKEKVEVTYSDIFPIDDHFNGFYSMDERKTGLICTTFTDSREEYSEMLLNSIADTDDVEVYYYPSADFPEGEIPQIAKAEYIRPDLLLTASIDGTAIMKTDSETEEEKNNDTEVQTESASSSTVFRKYC